MGRRVRPLFLKEDVIPKVTVGIGMYGFPLTPKEQQKVDQQAKNVPLRDGFVRSDLVQFQPSELKNMDDFERWQAERVNSGKEESR